MLKKHTKQKQTKKHINKTKLLLQLFYGHVRKPGMKFIKIEIDNVFFES
jgi:hypothetical protein